MLEKHPWLPTQLWEGADVGTALPLSGSYTSLAAVARSWGAVKSPYR